MTDKNDGGSAFPHESSVCSDHGIFPEIEPGMSLRNYFAAKAMQGLLAADTEFTLSSVSIAKTAYRQADAMLEAMK